MIKLSQVIFSGEKKPIKKAIARPFFIYQKIYDFNLFAYPLINKIPRFHKQVLGKYILEICTLLLVLVIKANKEKGQVRKNLQQKISYNLDCLRIIIRLTKDLKFISIKNYLAASEKLNEIGRMLSSWIKI